MPQLDPTWFASQLFWLAVTFVLLYVVLSRAILPPLMGIMTQRKNTIDGDLDAAQHFKTEAEEAKAEYERTLAEARGRSQQLLMDAMQAHKERAEQTSKDMDRQVAAKLADAESRIIAKKKELMEALKPAANDLAQAIVTKLMEQAPENGKTKSSTNPITKTNR